MTTPDTIAQLVTSAGYAVTRVLPYGSLNVHWQVFLSNDAGLTQATLTRRFALTRLECVQVGWEAGQGFIVVRVRRTVTQYQGNIDAN
jgi:hypothetical protein